MVTNKAVSRQKTAPVRMGCTAMLLCVCLCC